MLAPGLRSDRRGERALPPRSQPEINSSSVASNILQYYNDNIVMGSIKLFDREEMSVKKPLEALALVARDCFLFTYASAYEGRYILQNWRRRLKHHKHTKSHFECQYCNEYKREKDLFNSGAIPFDCALHLRGEQKVCKQCMDLALSTQLEFKPLLEVGCPECGVPWDPEEVRGLVSFKTQRKFLEMEKLARGQTLRPAELPDGATTETLLQVGTRFW